MIKLFQKIENYYAGKDYSELDLKAFVLGYTSGQINDMLMTKFLKSIYDKPLSIQATTQLTKIMMNSGEVISLDHIPGIKVDKHSTGGIGDKVTLIVAPLVASLGGCVAKMSGRGLGFTGGTIDKLESIPGFLAFLTRDEFCNNLQKHKIAVIGQTKNLVPADKKIYALRDEKNLIDSMPLIASSIMSKKLATGADAILIDVKVGAGAFMKTQSKGEELAKWMIQIGKQMNRNIKVEITSMTTPLGYEIGNRNEVLEAIRFLENKPAATDLTKVVLSSASTMLMQAKIFTSEKDALRAIKKALINGTALAKFYEWIRAQGGDLKALLQKQFWNPHYRHTVISTQSGYFNILNALDFGKLAMLLGAGRKSKTAKIDFDAGISLHVKTGDRVVKGAKLFTLFSSHPISDKQRTYLSKSYAIQSSKKLKQTILNKI